MDYYDMWYAIPEVYAVEDRLRLGCMKMTVSVDIYGYILYTILCKFEDVHEKYKLMNKIANIALQNRIRGRFILTAHDYYGNTVKQIIDY